ncbi:MAG: hypothetical protein ACQEP5_03215 [Actinomycetota bacterium]
MKVKEEDILKEGKYTKNTKVPRYLYTRFGQIKYSRYKAEKNGKYGFPLGRYVKIKKPSSCLGLIISLILSIHVPPFAHFMLRFFIANRSILTYCL